jgi:coenzyme PQQ synthesis protein D (PqqD)
MASSSNTPLCSHFAVVQSRRDELISREVDGKLVGLDLRSSQYFSLNPTGTFLWRLLESGTEPDALADALAEEHQVDRETAAADVQAFLSSLQEQQLIE